MLIADRTRTTVGICLLSIFLGLLLITLGIGIIKAKATEGSPATADNGEYVVLAWNDLGMHCYNRDFKDLAVLPPFNTLWAQVIEVGETPQIITTGITVEYFFADNTYSVGKTNFYSYTYELFGVLLPPDEGLAGFGLAGEMDVVGDHFEAVGIPLTEFRDSNLTDPYPYQIATVVVKDSSTQAELARVQAVAPVSTEMRCDNCHYDNGPGNDDFSTGVVEQNILSQHDEENLDDYPPGLADPLMSRRPILCAECHASNALGMSGQPGIPSLSRAMHEKHDGIVPDSQDGCYNCHPGPQTRCLRDVMSSSQYEMNCIDCHGSMYRVSRNNNPWLNEPRCDDSRCHGSAYAQDNPLYRLSKEASGVYCAGCHDSPHAIAPSREPNDAIKFLSMQMHPGPLISCEVCHGGVPEDAGPHHMEPKTFNFLFLPTISNK